MALVKREATIGQGEAKVGMKHQETRFPVVSVILGTLSLIGMMVSIWMIFLYAPTDAIQGEPQRIFYFHVPMAWLGMLGFVIVAIAGTAYLVKKDERWDWAARASAELGAFFITLALITGSICGKNIWWTWVPPRWRRSRRSSSGNYRHHRRTDHL